MLVEVEWTFLEERDPLWQDQLCLYAYVDARQRRILYIGKADFQTVRQRLYGVHKEDVFTFCDQHLGIEKMEFLQLGISLACGYN